MRITQRITRPSSYQRIIPWSLLSFLLLVVALAAALFTHEQSAASNQVVLTEFSDFQCPYCKRAANVVAQVRQTYGERVKVVFKQMPLPMHAHAFKAAQASVCAQEQGKFWQYHDRLFGAADLSVDALNRMAAEVGLNQNAFDQCIASDRSRAAVEKDIAEADRLGVSGTPTFFVNGSAVKGATSFAALKREIDAAALTRNDSALGVVQKAVPTQVLSRRDLSDALEAHGRQPKIASSVTSGGVTLSPATIDFGYQLVGTTGMPITETVTNSGAVPLVITDISVSGRDRRNFNSTYIFNLPVTVAPGNSITIDLTFTPSLPWRRGARDARLEVSEKAGNLQSDEYSQYVPLTGIGATCGGPLPSCSSGCSDSDGDGLNDAWEAAGGIDVNNDGVIDSQHDLLLAGADSSRPDIYVWYDWMDYGTDDESCGTDFDCNSLGSYHNGETCNSVGQCAYSCATDSDCTSRWPADAHAGERCVSNICEHTHDPLVANANAFQPVIERFAAHGINLHIQRGNAQPHSHVLSFRNDAEMTTLCEGRSVDSQDVGLGKYAVSFNDLKSRSNPDPLHLAYHYTVFAHYSGCDSFSHCPVSGGTISNCANRTLAFGQSGFAELAGNDFIVSLGSLVNNSALSPRFQTAGVFMHELGHNLGLHHGGHLDAACNTDADCVAGETCLDLNRGDGRACRETVNGIARKEEPNYKPNYLSIMNYAYQGNFIRIGASVGSRVPRGCSTNADCGGNGALCIPQDASSHCSISSRVCNSDADCPLAGESCVAPVVQKTCSSTGYVCATDSDCTGGDSCLPPSPGICARIDYSSQTLPTGGNTPGALDESNLDDNVGLGSGTADLFTYTDSLCHFCPLTAPTDGPVDWSGHGVFPDPSCNLHLFGVESFTDTGVQADVDGNGRCGTPNDVLRGYTDWPDLSGILFNYRFQCTPNGAQ